MRPVISYYFKKQITIIYIMKKGGYMSAKVRSSVEKSFASLYCFFV